MCLFLAKVTGNGGSRTNWSCSLNDRCGNNSRVKGDGNLVLEVFLGQVRPGLRTVRAITGLEGEVDLHLAGLTVKAAFDRRVGINLVTGEAGAVFVLDAIEKRCWLQYVGVAVGVVTGNKWLGRIIGSGQGIGAALAGHQRTGCSLGGRVLRLTVLQQHLRDFITALSLLNGVARLLKRLGADLRSLLFLWLLARHLRFLLSDGLGHLLHLLIGLICAKYVVLHPAIGHIFQLLIELFHIRHGGLCHRTEEQLRGLAHGLCLGGIFTWHGNDQGIAVDDNLRTRNTHAVDTLFQDVACLLELVLGGFLALRRQRYAGTALQVDAKLWGALTATS